MSEQEGNFKGFDQFLEESRKIYSQIQGKGLDIYSLRENDVRLETYELAVTLPDIERKKTNGKGLELLESDLGELTNILPEKFINLLKKGFFNLLLFDHNSKPIKLESLGNLLKERYVITDYDFIDVD